MPDKQVPIMPGMNENIDARHLPIGTPRLIQNMRVRNGARFEKRPGTVEIGEGSATGFAAAGRAGWVAEHRGLATVGVEEVSTRRGLASYTLSNNDQLWSRLGRHGVVVPERRTTISTDLNGLSGTGHTCAVVGGTVYVAFGDINPATTVTLLAVDPDGTVLRKTVLATSRFPRLIYADGVLYLVSQLTSGGGTTVEARTVTLSTLALSAAVTIGTLGSSGYRYDAAPVEGGSTWVLAYPTSAVNLRVVRVSGTSVVATADIVTVAAATFIGAAAYEGEYTCVAYADGTTVEASVLLTSTLVGSNYTVRAAAGSEVYAAQCGVARTAANTFAVVMSGTDTVATPSLDSKFIAHCLIDNAGALTGPYKVFHFAPASKPFTYGAAGERQVLIVAHNYNDATSPPAWWGAQARHYILELQPTAATGGGVNVAAISYEHLAFSTATLPEVAEIESGRKAALMPWSDANFDGVDLAIFRCNTAAQSMAWTGRQVVSAGCALHISGGCLYDVPEADIDGTHYAPENGFPHDPEVAVVASAGGSLTSGQEYTVVAVYRWLDAAGRVHRSAPSAPVTVTPSAGDLSITARIATCGGTGRTAWTARGGGPRVELYVAWSGGPFYLVDDAGAAASALSTTIIHSDADTAVTDNTVLYTDLGVLPNQPPSGARLVCASPSRMFTVGWKESVVEFSKLFITTAPWEFCDDDAFRIFLPEAITAIAYMDGTLVIFSQRSIYAVSGDGPDDTGAGGFSEPRRLSATVGSEGPHVVETSQGLMYKAAGTIWLLPRGFGAPVPVGDDIQETLAAYPFLRSAVLCANADDDCTHFVLADADTIGATTVVAVWDNRLSAWSLDDIDGDVGAAGSVDGAFTWLIPAWADSGDKPARYFDADSSPRCDLDSEGAATWIQSRIGFGDWRPAGPLGWCRFNKLQIHGERAGSFTLNLSVTVNAGSADAQTVYTKTSPFTSGGQFCREHRPHPEQGNSWRFDIYDSQPAATQTAGIVIHSLAFEAEEDPGLMRLAEEECF
jgi:hypothetical protein